MGGAVSIAIRKHGHTDVRQMPKYHAGVATLASFAANTYLQDTWFSRDWENSQSILLAPRHYGLVVIDHDTNWCGSCNDYGGVDEGLFDLNDDHHVNDLLQLFRQERVGDVHLVCDGGDEILLRISQSGDRLGNIRQAVIEAGDEPDKATLFADLRAPAGWVFDNFDAGEPDDWIKFMQTMEDRGFNIQPPDILAEWDSFFSGKPLKPNPVDAWRARGVAKTLEEETPGARKAVARRSL